MLIIAQNSVIANIKLLKISCRLRLQCSFILVPKLHRIFQFYILDFQLAKKIKMLYYEHMIF